jgi:hypothetical protein
MNGSDALHPNNNSNSSAPGGSSSSAPSGNSFKIPKININKLSAEDQALMQRSIKAFAKEKQGGRLRGGNNRAKYVEPTSSSSESDNDDDSNDKATSSSSKAKSKFFKHTEKERDEERRRQKDERRRQRRRMAEDDDDDYEAEDDGGGGGSRKRKAAADDSDDESEGLAKRRRRGDEPSAASPPPDLDNFVPKKVSRKIERKLVPRIQKIDPEMLMESNNFKRFNKTMETVFDNAEEVRTVIKSCTVVPKILYVPYAFSFIVHNTAPFKLRRYYWCGYRPGTGNM